MNQQTTLFLPDRETDEILREKLSDLVEQANAETDSAERLRQHVEITRLRRLLAEGRSR